MAIQEIMTRLKTFWRSTSGTALVEFVLVFPMMILVFAIMVEFGRLYWGYQSVVAGVRDASRYVARVGPVDVCLSGSTSGSLLPLMPNVTAASLKAAIEESYTSAGDNMLPALFTVGTVSATYSCTVNSTYRPGKVPLATVSAPVTMTFPLGHLFSIFGSSFTSVTATVSDDARIYGT